MLDAGIAGLIPGAAYAILAVCVVLVYRLTGVLNFGQAGLGALGAYVSYALLDERLPLWLAVTIGLCVGGGVAALCGWVVARWFSHQSHTVLTVVTIVILVVVLTLGFRVFGDSPRIMPSLFPVHSVDIGGVRISLNTFIAVLLTLAVCAALTLMLRFTRFGTQLLALSERPVTLQLMGVNARALTTVTWAVAGAVSTFALLLIAPTRQPPFETMTFMIVPALAAGLLGSFSNVWIAAVGGLAIGVLEGLGARLPLFAEYRGVVPILVIIAALVWLRRREVWDAAR